MSVLISIQFIDVLINSHPCLGLYCEFRSCTYRDKLISSLLLVRHTLMQLLFDGERRVQIVVPQFYCARFSVC